MRYLKYLILLILLSGCCHTHNHIDQHLQIDNNKAYIKSIAKKSNTVWLRFNQLNGKFLFLGVKIIKQLRRIETLERLTGGRRNVLQDELIELEEDD